jgi:hypothetical protein
MRWILLLLGAVLMLPAAAQTREVVWERWDVDIFDVDTTTNAFRVRESYEVRFSGTFRFGTVFIPDDRLTAIEDPAVVQGGNALTPACDESPGTFCFERATDGYAMTYYFVGAITDATETFEIEYTVRGALRVYEGGDQIWWVAVPEDKFGFSVASSTITVDLPVEPRPGIDPVVTYGVAANVVVDGSRVVATATDPIGPDEAFEIRVQYPHNPAAIAPPWQRAFDRQRDAFDAVRRFVHQLFDDSYTED